MLNTTVYYFQLQTVLRNHNIKIKNLYFGLVKETSNVVIFISQFSTTLLITRKIPPKIHLGRKHQYETKNLVQFLGDGKKLLLFLYLDGKQFNSDLRAVQNYVTQLEEGGVISRVLRPSIDRCSIETRSM